MQRGKSRINAIQGDKSVVAKREKGKINWNFNCSQNERGNAEWTGAFNIVGRIEEQKWGR